ncbi:MAG: hypothetical protein ACJ77L_17100 [Solirubrobacteraceae bacterium]
MDELRRIADAVLYEGYVLWPYRKSALKNQRRWTFGGVYPPAHSAVHPDDPARMQAQVLVRGRPAVEASARFLHVVERQVLRDGVEPVDELECDGERHVSWEEATEREISTRAQHADIAIEGGSAREPIAGGAIERRWRPLHGSLAVASEELGGDVHRLTVTIRNETSWTGSDREDALRQTFCSTHAVLRARGGEFVSLTDPPAELAGAAAACHNTGGWPVLVGEEGDRTTMLCSPIILPDYPRVAPESPGDLFDGGEIDQLLVLNILALTDDEKRAMRESDPRARDILERTEHLSEEELMRLHGARR